jgi:hypothetical protein
MKTLSFQRWQRMIVHKVRMYNVKGSMPTHSDYIRNININYQLMGKIMAIKMEERRCHEL